MTGMRPLLKFLENKRTSSQANLQGGFAQGGFTLLEVIIAMAIMVLAFAAILSVESGSINASARARQMNVVAMLAKNKMVETEYEIEGKTFDEVAKESTGAFESPFEDYSWKTTIKEMEFPNFNVNKKSGDSSGSSSGDIAELASKLMTKYFSKALREITVSISWKRGSGQQSFSVSTYWVDLNHEFELSP